MSNDHRLICGGCGHEDIVPDDPAQTIYVCDECATMTAFGLPMPRIRILPHDDKRFVRVLFNWGRGDEAREAEFTLARPYASRFAGELLSVCDVEKWQAICALAAASAQ